MNELMNAQNITAITEMNDVEAIKNLASKKLETHEELKVMRKEKRELINETLRAVPEYADLEIAIKEQQAQLKELKKKLMKEPELAKVEVELKDTNRNIREIKKDISDFLVLWADKTGQLSFVHKNGNEIHIQKQARVKIVVKRKKFFIPST